jgi:hypothetical protein
MSAFMVDGAFGAVFLAFTPEGLIISQNYNSDFTTATIMGDPLETGRWAHLAVTVAPGEQVLYVDGVAVGFNNIFLGPVVFDSSTTYVVGAPDNDPLVSVDDLRIFDKALTAAEVSVWAAIEV